MVAGVVLGYVSFAFGTWGAEYHEILELVGIVAMILTLSTFIVVTHNLIRCKLIAEDNKKPIIAAGN